MENIINDDKIILREFKKEDSKKIEDIIRKTWVYDRFTNEKISSKLARAYLYSCLADQTYTQVTVVDGVTAGIIMGKNIAKHKCSINIRIKEILAIVSLYISKEGRKASRIFVDVNKIDKELLRKSNKEYEGEVTFFAVDSNYRGRGLGGLLFNSVKRYMEKEGINEFYLYTDTTCNYKFYEHEGMRKNGQKEHTFMMGDKKETMKFFLYEDSIKKGGQ